MTPLKQKYAQVSDGCWESPTAVQVGLSEAEGLLMWDIVWKGAIRIFVTALSHYFFF